MVYVSGHFKSKETDFCMSNSIINNLTSTNQTKLLFYAKCLSRLWLYGSILGFENAGIAQHKHVKHA